MKYVSLLVLFACSASLSAMDDDGQALPEMIKSDMPPWMYAIALPGVIRSHLRVTARSVVFSPTSNEFLTVEENGIWAYDGDYSRMHRFRGFEKDIHDIFFSPRGDKIVTRFVDGSVIIEDEKQTRPLLDNFPPAPFLFKFNSKGDSVRQIDDTTVRVDFDLAQQVPSGVFIRCNLGEIISASIDDNGHVAIASKGKVQLWDYKQGKIIKERVYKNNNISLVRLNPTGDRMAINSWSGNDQESSKTEVWDMQGDEPLYSTPNAFNGVRFVDDNLLVTSGVNCVTIIDSSTGVILRSIACFNKQVGSSCSFSPNNKYFAQSYDDMVDLYDTQGNLLTTVKHDGEVTSVQAVSPKGDSLAVMTPKGISIWRLKHLLQKQAKL